MPGLFKHHIVLIVDVSNLAYRAIHGYKQLKHEGKPSGHVFGTTTMLLAARRRLLEKQQADSVALQFAVDRGSTKRDILPQYKANRTHGTESGMVTEVERLVKLFPGSTYAADNTEADDVIATLARRAAKKESTSVVVYTTDRDLYQLIGPRINVLYKDRFVDAHDLQTNFEIDSPKQVALVKALLGDKSDNIPPAIPRLKKEPVLTAIRCLGLVRPKDLRERWEELPKQLREGLDDHWSELRRNWKVVRLDTEVKLKRKDGPASPDELIDLLKKYGCRSLFDKVKELWQC